MSFKPKYPPFETRSRIKKWCDLQERAQAEVKEKLRSWNVAPSDADQIIVELIEENYINEIRFAKAYTSGKYRIKRWGWRKIEMGLKSKKISSYCIAEAKKEIDDEEYKENLKKVIETKLKTVSGKSDWEKKQKVLKYAVSRGYSFDDAKEYLDL